MFISGVCFISLLQFVQASLALKLHFWLIGFLAKKFFLHFLQDTSYLSFLSCPNATINMFLYVILNYLFFGTFDLKLKTLKK